MYKKKNSNCATNMSYLYLYMPHWQDILLAVAYKTLVHFEDEI